MIGVPAPAVLSQGGRGHPNTEHWMGVGRSFVTHELNKDLFIKILPVLCICFSLTMRVET